MMSDFNVGDRIVVTENFCSAKVGMTGTVIALCDRSSALDCAVCFDEPFPGANSCGGKCDIYHGHYMTFSAIEHIDIDHDQPFDVDEEVKFY